eukprot:IDg22400t1
MSFAVPIEAWTGNRAQKNNIRNKSLALHRTIRYRFLWGQNQLMFIFGQKKPILVDMHVINHVIE